MTTASAELLLRDAALGAIAEQRCERGTPWDAACVACYNAVAALTRAVPPADDGGVVERCQDCGRESADIFYYGCNEQGCPTPGATSVAAASRTRDGWPETVPALHPAPTADALIGPLDPQAVIRQYQGDARLMPQTMVALARELIASRAPAADAEVERVAMLLERIVSRSVSDRGVIDSMLQQAAALLRERATPPVASNCAAVAAEREACAVIADDIRRGKARKISVAAMICCDQIAAAIRARSAAPARGPQEGE